MKNRALPVLMLTLLGAAGIQRQWENVNHKSWRITDSEASQVPAVPSSPVCGPNMVEVQGSMKQDRPGSIMTTVEELQKTTCTKWINRDFPERCAQFDQAAWEAIAATLPTKPMHFCIDAFEYPNVAGQYPLIFITFNEAQDMCLARGARLCNEEEWTFACEGPEALPYPYGYARDSTACNIDRQWRVFNEKNMYPRDGTTARDELDHLWQGEASGTSPRCVSPFGVYDLTGNVDEWTTAVRPSPHASVLKGGYWGPVRTRCRPATRVHAEGHYFYQQGFRCCSDTQQPVVDSDNPL